MTKLLLSILVFISGTLTIFFEYGDRRFVYFFKPLTMLLVIALAWVYCEKKGGYRTAILIGFFFSLLGDFLLIDSSENFVLGLTSFLLAHICYAYAFARGSEGEFKKTSLLAYAFGIVLLGFVYADIPTGLKIPVTLYTFAITTMLSLALNFWLTQKTPKAKLALTGAILFVLSDSFIAVNKFSYEFFLSKLIILALYFTAQWLIARSV